MCLTAEEILLVKTAIVQQLDLLPMEPVILGVGPDHVHLVACFGELRIRPTVGRLKSFATRAVPNPGNRKRLWTKECHMESLETEAALEYAVAYVRQHAEQGALIHEWA